MQSVLTVGKSFPGELAGVRIYLTCGVPAGANLPGRLLDAMVQILASIIPFAKYAGNDESTLS
jgi:hypothetical protein